MRWLIAVLFLCSPALAEDRSLKDVKAWLDGCAALVPEDVTDGIASVMVMNCTEQAIAYCDVGRSEEFRPPCKTNLTRAMEADLDTMRPRIKMPEGMRGREGASFENLMGWAYPDAPRACDGDHPQELCALAQTSLRWVYAHSLARRMGVRFSDLAARP